MLYLASPTLYSKIVLLYIYLNPLVRILRPYLKSIDKLRLTRLNSNLRRPTLSIVG